MVAVGRLAGRQLSLGCDVECLEHLGQARVLATCARVFSSFAMPRVPFEIRGGPYAIGPHTSSSAVVADVDGPVATVRGRGGSDDHVVLSTLGPSARRDGTSPRRRVDRDSLAGSRIAWGGRARGGVSSRAPRVRGRPVAVRRFVPTRGSSPGSGARPLPRRVLEVGYRCGSSGPSGHRPRTSGLGGVERGVPTGWERWRRRGDVGRRRGGDRRRGRGARKSDRTGHRARTQRRRAPRDLGGRERGGESWGPRFAGPGRGGGRRQPGRRARLDVGRHAADRGGGGQRVHGRITRRPRTSTPSPIPSPRFRSTRPCDASTREGTSVCPSPRVRRTWPGLGRPEWTRRSSRPRGTTSRWRTHLPRTGRVSSRCSMNSMTD